MTDAECKAMGLVRCANFWCGFWATPRVAREVWRKGFCPVCVEGARAEVERLMTRPSAPPERTRGDEDAP